MQGDVHWGLWISAVALGLAGSLHCAGMCGPLMLALPGPAGSRLRWIAGRCLYHLGRVTTYAGLGVVFGLLGRSLAWAGVQRWVSLVLGALLLGGLFWNRLWHTPFPGWNLPAWLTRGMQELMREHSVPALYGLGLLNGFLPCGLVYVAAAAATASGSFLHALQFMVGFGLGTVPLTLALTLAPGFMPAWVRIRVRRWIPYGVALVGVLLVLRGLALGIPYLSPGPAPDSSPTCCH
ncbi:sulfite exporter TauE/SafE family protein [Limisphaera ngatamarikiensis]|uniref:Sulfite exporter TauE/SafE family protein n=1 Tax=Limisphaera ngatamarikiensis TaxID=1324935 RepID=A0A6M1RDT6_9BACT|nr:sulfite exporter TauE/SafE family protein [Limisphaera ngatamarikiensis]NGO38268.1 sulfite exporter TauE/SafE family protein [Limisphaera ngatamarikiensis]